MKAVTSSNYPQAILQLLLIIVTVVVAEVHEPSPFVQVIPKNYDHLLSLSKHKVRAALPQQEQQPAPLILVPGLGGSRMYATKNNVDDEPHFWCAKNSNPYCIWINVKETIPYLSFDCFKHDIQPHYNMTSRTITSTKGVTIRPYDFGSTSSVEYLVSDLPSKTEYMAPFIRYLVDNYGYVKDVSLRAAPYDFRMGLREYSSPDGYFSQLKKLVEETFELNNDRRVNLLGHSMGAPMINLFLVTYVDQSWKDKYIASMISLGGPFLGSHATPALAFTGTSYGIPTISNTDMIPVVRSAGGSAMMMPRKASQPLFTSKIGVNYTTDQVVQFFKDVHDPSCASLISRELEQSMAIAPNVPVFCIYGVNYPTASLFEITDWKSPNFTVVGMENGDATVQDYSLRACDDFAQQQSADKYPVSVFTSDKNMTHTEMIYNPVTWEKVLDYMNNIRSR